MKKIIDSSILFAVFTLVAIATAKAETVVWYTFDDLTPGDTLADGSTVENKAKSGTHDATVYGMAGASPKETSINMPVVTNGVPEAYRLFDPCTWSYAQNQDLGIRFTAPFTGSATGDGARLEIANHADLRPDAFTVEAMVRLPADLDGSETLPGWELIAGQPAFMPCVNADAWRIFLQHVENQRKAIPAVRFAKQDSFESNVNATNLVAYYNQNLNLADGKWHHLALVVRPNAADSTKTDVSFYVDYKGAMDNSGSTTKTLPNRIRFSDAENCPLWIGGTKQTYQLYRGALGEFRFSNEALSPEQFLRPGAVASGFDKDCVLYYDFEEAAEDWDWFGDSSRDVVNKAMPGIMDGTIITNNSLAPEFVEDSPVERLRQSMASAVYETSEKSLTNSITSASSRKDGYVECMPLDVDWFSKTNFTVECFFKTENMTQTYTPLFRRWGGANVQVNIGVGGYGGNMGINISTNAATKQTERNISSFSAGTWNHVALVVNQTGETKTIKTYFNWHLKETFPLPSNLADTNKDGASGLHYEKWFVAGADGGNSFDGKIDSMRVTLRALEPQEFLTARPYTSGSTIAHISFDDETPNASADYGALCQGVYQGNAKAEIGYSDDVPGALIRDGLGGELITKHNLKSISFPDTTNHAWVSYGSIDKNPVDTYYLHTSRDGQYRTSGTIEFWMKSSQTDADYDTVLWGGYARTTNAVGDVTSYQHSLIRFNNAHRLEFGFAANGTWNCLTAANTDVLNGKWHHVAFTFKPAPTDSSKMVATGYIDYEQVDTITCDGQLRLENNGYFDLRFAGEHGSGFGHKNFGGLIDELRFSNVALEPSQFLRAERAPGFAIFIR